MAAGLQQQHRPRSEPDRASVSLMDDSAVEILRSIEEERGKMFTETEYREMRQVVLDELAHGARCRPFTLVTFGVILLGLAAMFVIGLITATGTSLSDLALPLVSAAAMLAVGWFVWSYFRGLRYDAFRSLDERLAELEQLRVLNLVSAEEYATIHAHIL